MSKTRIFLSSTCYDLAAVREDIREHIENLGHEPLLSEYPSFPVSPDKTAITNCRSNIEKHTDILILVIGGCRGSLDDASGKSITNLEYESAKQCGIPCFVFINRSVDTLRHVWKKNPDADFSPTVDYPYVFEFIERIHTENHWTFTFEKTREIKDILTIQLSTLLRDLLDRSKGGKLSPVPGFENESPEAQRLARDKPKYWEFFLAAELLDSKIQKIKSAHDAVLAGRFHQISQGFSDIPSFVDWTSIRMSDMCSILQAVEKQLPLISISMGPPGVAGNCAHMQRRINELIDLCHSFVDFEKDIVAAHPPDGCEALKQTMRGWTSLCLQEIQRLPIELRKPFQDNSDPEGNISINLKFGAPDIKPFMKELKRLEKKYIR